MKSQAKEESIFVKKILSNFNQFVVTSSKTRNFFGILNEVQPANIGIFGGAVRDWHLNYLPKDVDIVLDGSYDEFDHIIKRLTDNFEYEKSAFDGYCFDLDGVYIDLWELQKSWIFQQNAHLTPNWDELLMSVPFNIDAIVVFLDGIVLDSGFFSGVEKTTIELQCGLNKDPERNIIERAKRFQKKYGFKFGRKLSKYLKDNQKSEPKVNDMSKPLLLTDLIANELLHSTPKRRSSN